MNVDICTVRSVYYVRLERSVRVFDIESEVYHLRFDLLGRVRMLRQFPGSVGNHFKLWIVEREVYVRSFVFPDRIGVFYRHAKTALSVVVHGEISRMHFAEGRKTHFIDVGAKHIYAIRQHVDFHVVPVPDDCRKRVTEYDKKRLVGQKMALKGRPVILFFNTFGGQKGHLSTC